MQRDIEYIRQCVNEWGECKSMALTTQAAIILVGWNGYAYSGNIPRGLKEVLQEAVNNNMSINDVILKENGGWLVIYNDYYDAQGEIIPRNLCNALSYIRSRNGRVFSADWEKGAKLLSQISSDINIQGMFPDIISSNDELVYSTLYDGDVLISTISAGADNMYVINRTQNGCNERYAYDKGNLIPYLDPDVACPLYPIINGQVQNAHMIKVFYGSRYFVANKDGSQYYFYI